MHTILLFVFLVPLIAATYIALFLRRSQWLGAMVSVTSALLCMALSLQLLSAWDGQVLTCSMPWLKLGSFTLSLGILFNSQTALMLAVVTVIGALIHIFSLGYMDHDTAKSRYFAGLSLFMFSMMGILLSDNLIMLFIFWELVGFSSYLLIAHYHTTEFATMASKKAFIANRIGDLGFLLGIVWSYWHFGTVQLTELQTLTALHPEALRTGISLLLVCGFIGKSAQFPLHVWLPDAMAGPTPVSALIHAATMVAAGIYLLARIFFLLTPCTLNTLLWLCSGMTLFAGLCALGQNDIKKILAYSTLSQLGYMGTAVALGFPGLGLFHMSTHACFKAVLFLCAGSVIHALHHEQDIFKMGGLWRRMPITSATFIIGTLALCALYGTSGFYSKDAILQAAFLQHPPTFYLTTLAAFLTSFYMGRLLCVAFFGTANSPKAAHAHESSLTMTAPLVILAILSIIAGYITLWPSTLSLSCIGDLNHITEAIHTQGLHTLFTVANSLLTALGLGFAFIIYRPGATQDALALHMQGLYALFKQSFKIDALYNGYISGIQQRFAQFMNILDVVFLGGVAMRGSAGFVGFSGMLLRKLHVGNLQAYAYWFFIGIFFFCLVAFNHA